MTCIADTGFIMAVASQSDPRHEACLRVYLRQPFIYLPQSTLAELGYMLIRNHGYEATTAFLRRLPDTKYRVIALIGVNFLRTAEILETYADAKLDFVDATIVALAERMKITRILTVDRRDFGMIRPRHTTHFEILP